MRNMTDEGRAAPQSIVVNRSGLTRPRCARPPSPVSREREIGPYARSLASDSRTGAASVISAL